MHSPTDSSVFADQVALVTGAAAGIGRATALAFARAGARVVVSDVAAGPGEETAELIRRHGGTARFVRCDVARPDEVHGLVARTVAEFGRLDHAFNNAGIEGAPAPLAESSEENWNRTLAVNLSGVYWCMREELAVMLRQGGGNIVNCSSIAGIQGFAAMGAYVASKHGVVGLTRSAAMDYAAKNIRINAVCPGVIQTAMIDRFTGGDAKAAQDLAAGAPIRRLGRPEEIADAVLWLCKPGAGFVVGAEIVVDGGWSAG